MSLKVFEGNDCSKCQLGFQDNAEFTTGCDEWLLIAAIRAIILAKCQHGHRNNSSEQVLLYDVNHLAHPSQGTSAWRKRHDYPLLDQWSYRQMFKATLTPVQRSSVFFFFFFWPLQWISYTIAFLSFFFFLLHRSLKLSLRYTVIHTFFSMYCTSLSFFTIYVIFVQYFSAPHIFIPHIKTYPHVCVRTEEWNSPHQFHVCISYHFFFSTSHSLINYTVL